MKHVGENVTPFSKVKKHLSKPTNVLDSFLSGNK